MFMMKTLRGAPRFEGPLFLIFPPGVRAFKELRGELRWPVPFADRRLLCAAWRWALSKHNLGHAYNSDKGKEPYACLITRSKTTVPQSRLQHRNNDARLCEYGPTSLAYSGRPEMSFRKSRQLTVFI